jgi:hypothetical protein
MLNIQEAKTKGKTQTATKFISPMPWKMCCNFLGTNRMTAALSLKAAITCMSNEMNHLVMVLVIEGGNLWQLWGTETMRNSTCLPSAWRLRDKEWARQGLEKKSVMSCPGQPTVRGQDRQDGLTLILYLTKRVCVKYVCHICAPNI